MESQGLQKTKIYLLPVSFLESKFRCFRIAVVAVAKQYMALTTQILKKGETSIKRSNFLGQNVCRKEEVMQTQGFLQPVGQTWIEAN